MQKRRNWSNRILIYVWETIENHLGFLFTCQIQLGVDIERLRPWT